ncbi:MAG TPA: TQO small subunit DoxD [Gemmatimonadales bacterium]|jgi:thiosulfate dehydrogenase [quinone] large subunit
MTSPPSTPTAIDMSHASRWLAVLRILVGLWFAKALTSKMDLVLLGGFVPFLGVEPRWLQKMPELVARQAAENPLLWYKAFLEQTVLVHSELFARFTAWGEVLVGVSLILGLFAGLGALGGLWLSLNYGLASAHMSAASLGFHYMLVITMSLLFLARSGRALGLDAWVAWRWPGRWMTWRPFQ